MRFQNFIVRALPTKNSVLDDFSESVSTGVWCVPGFGAGFENALEPSKLQKEGENSGKGHFYFLRQTLVCTKPWFERDLRFSPNPPRNRLFFCYCGLAVSEWGNGLERFGHDGLSCSPSAERHRAVMQMLCSFQVWSSLSKTRGVVSHLCGGTVFVCPLPRGVGLSQIPGSPPLCSPPPPIKSIPIRTRGWGTFIYFARSPENFCGFFLRICQGIFH